MRQHLSLSLMVPVALILTGCFLRPVTVTGLNPPADSKGDNTSSTIKFTWNEITGTDHYQVQLSSDSNFDDQDEIFDTPTFRFTLPDPQTCPVTVYWRVKPVFRQFWKRSAWSQPSSITVEHQPVVPARLKSPAQGRTFKNTAGLLLEWDTPIPAGSQAVVEIFDPADGEILWSGKVNGRKAIPFSEISGLEHSEEAKRLGCRFTTVNRFGETAASEGDILFRVADPWLPVDLAEELYFACSGENFGSIWSTGRGITVREVSFFPDNTLTAAPVKIPAGESVEVVSGSPEVLARGPGGLQRFLLPLMEIRWQNRRGFVNGGNILLLSNYPPDEETDGNEIGILWRVNLLPDTWTGELYITYDAEFCLYRPGQPLVRQQLTLFDDPHNNSYLVPREWYRSDVDGDGTDEAVIEGYLGAFIPHSNAGYSGWGSYIFRINGEMLSVVMEEMYYYEGYENSGVYTWHDGDGDGIRETIYREWTYNFTDEYNPEESEPVWMVLTEIWTRDPWSGIYQPVSEERIPLDEGYTYVYAQYTEGDLVHSGGK